MSKEMTFAEQPPDGYDPRVDRLPDRVLRLETRMDNLTDNFATKEDLSEIYHKLDNKLEATRADFNKAFGDMDAKFEKRFGDMDAKFEKRFGEVETKIEATKTEIMKATNTQFRWTIGIVGTLVVGMFGGMAGVVYSTQNSTNAALDRMDRRIEASEQARDRRFEEMNQAMERRFEAMDRRFERLEQVLFVPATPPVLKSPQPASD